VFARVPEVANQTDPVLKTLDQLWEDDQRYRQVRDDLGKRSRHTLVQGRHSTPVEVLVRMLLCKPRDGWSSEETRERGAENLVLRWFCRVYFQTVPDKSTLIRLPP
jgi:IS5 family transposase